MPRWPTRQAGLRARHGLRRQRYLSLSAVDALGANDSTSIPIVVAGPLTIAAPATPQVVKVGGTLAISGVSIADPDLPTANNVTVALAATNGTIVLSTSTFGGISNFQVTGNGTGSVTTTAPLAAINATLADFAGLSYTPAPGFNGADTLAVSASDPWGNNATSVVSLLSVGPLVITALRRNNPWRLVAPR